MTKPHLKITPCSCHCGGNYAWMRERSSGAWEMIGCICHNPDLFSPPDNTNAIKGLQQIVADLEEQP